MLGVGAHAPDFTLPMVTRDGVEQFTLARNLGSGPVVLVFFPGAFTGTCRSELAAFRDRRATLGAQGATILGVSVDTPLVLEAFQEAEEFGFPLLSDTDREVVDAYDVTVDFPEKLATDLAARAIVVIDADGHVDWTWRGDPAEEPDYDAVEAAVEDAREPETLSASESEDGP